VTIFVLRLALAPLTILIASIVERRLGPLRGGRLIGLPLTTGPFLVVLCLSYDATVAAHAAEGVISGQMVVVGYCLAYGRAAARFSPVWTMTVSLAAGTVAGLAIGPVRPVWLASVIVVITITLGLATWPSTADPARRVEQSRRFPMDTAVRMAVAGGLVASLTGAARLVGSFAAGMLSAAPVILAVMGPATHRRSGPGAAAELMRGTLASIPGAVLFTTVIALTLRDLGASSFGLAVAALAAAVTIPWNRAPELVRPWRSAERARATIPMMEG
jgi:hypothetical protein